MKKLSLMVMVAVAAISFQACNGSKDSKETADSVNAAKDTSNAVAAGIAVDENDAKFAVDAANGGMAEVALAKLAQAKATNAKVKEFADYKTKKVALPSISSTVPPTYKLPEKLLKLDYFLKINEQNSKRVHDISDASDISALLTFIDEEQCKILLKQYRERFGHDLKVEIYEEPQAQNLQCSNLGEPVLNK